MPHSTNGSGSWGIRATDLGIRRGRSTILTGFDWEHCAGEIAWIIGGNGAGKSSLLRILAGRENPAAGTIRRLAPPNGEESVLYYHPSMGLPDSLTVGAWQSFVDQISTPGSRRSVPPDLIPEGAVAGKRLDRLSTGEAKRLALYAILQRPASFLILDEPFEHLSPDAKEILYMHLRERARTAVVVVATNQEIPADSTGPVLSYDGEMLAPIAEAR